MSVLNSWSQFPPCDFGTTDEDVISLIKSGELDPNSTDQFGGSILLRAISIEKLEVVKTLLDYGANPNKIIKNEYQVYSPLILSFNIGNTEILFTLLEKGADPNTVGEGNISFLQFYKEYKKKRLTDKDVNMIDKYISPGINIKPKSSK